MLSTYQLAVLSLVLFMLIDVRSMVVRLALVVRYGKFEARIDNESVSNVSVQYPSDMHFKRLHTIVHRSI